MDITAGAARPNGGFNHGPIRTFANPIHPETRAQRMQRGRCLNQFAQTFLYVHAPNIGDHLRIWINVQLAPGFSPFPDVELREIAPVEKDASPLPWRAHKHSLLAQVLTLRKQKIGLAQDGPREPGGDGVADVVEIGSNTYSDDRDREGLADL